MQSLAAHVETSIAGAPPVAACPHCGEEINVSLFGRGAENVGSAEDQKSRQRADMIQDANESAHPNRVSLAELKEMKRE